VSRQQSGLPSLAARGVAFTVGKGDSTFDRAVIFAELGYATAIFRDDDKEVSSSLKAKAAQLGIKVIDWGSNFATEECLFQSLPNEGIIEFLKAAVEFNTEDALRDHISNCSNKTLTLNDCLASCNDNVRKTLGAAAKKYSWFKSITDAEVIGDIVGRYLITSGPRLSGTLDTLFIWADTVEASQGDI
jgi:putative ATP-dependent endonuclease of OLD family